jgi:hypothetical protein
MAVGIDIGFIGAELSQVIVGEKLRRTISRYLQCLILGTLVIGALTRAEIVDSEAG